MNGVNLMKISQSYGNERTLTEFLVDGVDQKKSFCFDWNKFNLAFSVILLLSSLLQDYTQNSWMLHAEDLTIVTSYFTWNQIGWVARVLECIIHVCFDFHVVLTRVYMCVCIRIMYMCWQFKSQPIIFQRRAKSGYLIKILWKLKW